MSRLFEALQRSEAERSGSTLPQMPSAATELLQAAEQGELGAEIAADFSSAEFSSPDFPSTEFPLEEMPPAPRCAGIAEHDGRAAEPAAVSDCRRPPGLDHATGWAGSGEIQIARRALAQHAGEPNPETNSGNKHYPRGRQERGICKPGSGFGSRGSNKNGVGRRRSSSSNARESFWVGKTSGARSMRWQATRV